MSEGGSIQLLPGIAAHKGRRDSGQRARLSLTSFLPGLFARERTAENG